MTLAHWLRQDVDLSYINVPYITTLLLVAGFADLRKHYLCWALEPVPDEVLDMVCQRPDGKTLRAQLRDRFEVGGWLTRALVNRNGT
jgi:hypothetical protein